MTMMITSNDQRRLSSVRRTIHHQAGHHHHHHHHRRRRHRRHYRWCSSTMNVMVLWLLQLQLSLLLGLSSLFVGYYDNAKIHILIVEASSTAAAAAAAATSTTKTTTSSLLARRCAAGRPPIAAVRSFIQPSLQPFGRVGRTTKTMTMPMPMTTMKPTNPSQPTSPMVVGDFGDLLTGTTLTQHPSEKMNDRDCDDTNIISHRRYHHHNLISVRHYLSLSSLPLRCCSMVSMVRELKKQLQLIPPSPPSHLHPQNHHQPSSLYDNMTRTRTTMDSTMEMTDYRQGRRQNQQHQHQHDYGDVLLGTASSWKRMRKRMDYLHNNLPQQQQQHHLDSDAMEDSSDGRMMVVTRLGSCMFCEQPYQAKSRTDDAGTVSVLVPSLPGSSSSSSVQDNDDDDDTVIDGTRNNNDAMLSTGGIMYGDVLLGTATSWGRLKDNFAQDAQYHHQESEATTYLNSDNNNNIMPTTTTHNNNNIESSSSSSLFHGDVLLGMAFLPPPVIADDDDNVIVEKPSTTASSSSSSSANRRLQTGNQHHTHHNNDVVVSNKPKTKRRKSRSSSRTIVNDGPSSSSSLSLSFGDVLLATSSSWKDTTSRNQKLRQQQQQHQSQQQHLSSVLDDGVVEYSFGDLLLGASTCTTATATTTTNNNKRKQSSSSSRLFSSSWRLPTRGGGGGDDGSGNMGNNHSPLIRETVGTMSIMPLPLLSVIRQRLSGMGFAVKQSIQHIVLQSNKLLPEAIRSNILLKTVGTYCFQAAIGVVIGRVVAGLYIKFVRMPQLVQYLEWDAQELVPEALIEYQEGLQASSSSPSKVQVQILLRKVNEAKARQVEVLSQKYCPEQWKAYQRDILSSSSTSSSEKLEDHLTWLRKLTKALYETNFPALMRPDYVFGLGRKGINITGTSSSSSLLCKEPTPGGLKNRGDDNTMTAMIDPQLLDAVITDLEQTAPEQYPTIWGTYQAKLLPGQVLANRHDLVLRMVKDIQIQKQQQKQDQEQHQHQHQAS